MGRFLIWVFNSLLLTIFFSLIVNYLSSCKQEQVDPPDGRGRAPVEKTAVASGDTGGTKAIEGGQKDKTQSEKPKPDAAKPESDPKTEGDEITVPSSKFDRNFAIVADFDDTLKATNTADTLSTIINAFFSDEPFPGMSTLAAELTNVAGTDRSAVPFFVVSAAPQIIRYKIDEFLDTHSFPKPDRMYLKGFFGTEETQVHKKSSLDDMAKAWVKPVLMFGDDAEFDPQVYSDHAIAHRDKVKGIYIHKIKGSPLPGDVFGYYSAFDVALNEYKANRLKLASVLAIGRVILEAEPKRVIPDYAVCPSQGGVDQAVEDSSLKDLKEKVFKKIADYCQKR